MITENEIKAGLIVSFDKEEKNLYAILNIFPDQFCFNTKTYKNDLGKLLVENITNNLSRPYYVSISEFLNQVDHIVENK